MKNKILTIAISLVAMLQMVSGINTDKIQRFPSTIIVDDEGDGDYTSIQDAVNHAENGDTILVYSGNYFEEVEINYKEITIEGVPHEFEKGDDMGKPVIIARSEECLTPALVVNSNNCTIKNMQLEGCKGIVIHYGNYNKIIHNDILNCRYWGIVVEGDSNYNEICGNNVSNITLGGGIQIDGSDGNMVFSNKISICKGRGIQVSASETKIERNIIQNAGTGIMLYYASKTEIIENNVSNNGAGIAVLNSIFTLIQHNNLINNSPNGEFSDAYFCIWYENYWDDWTLPIPKPIRGDFWIPIPFIWWFIIVPWIQFDWHPSMQPYEWWKE